MSSLMQFGGSITQRGVGLQFVKVAKGPDWERYNGPAAFNPSPDGTTFTKDADTYTCGTCGKTHARIAVAYRRPVGMFGCWVLFRYNGATHAPDLSVPISVFQYPRGARVLSEEESSAIWHSS